jgi:nitroreductase
MNPRGGRSKNRSNIDVHERVRTRHGIGGYRSDPVRDDGLARVFGAVRLVHWGDGGTSRRPARLVVRDREARELVAALCHGQTFPATALLVVIAGGPESGSGYSPVSWRGWYSGLIGAAIADDHLTLAARAEGLDTCRISSFDNTGLRQPLALSECVNITVVTRAGYPGGREFVGSRDRRRVTTGELVQWGRLG